MAMSCGTKRFLFACVANDIDVVKEELEAGHNAAELCAALTIAVSYSRGEIVEVLLEHGANVNAVIRGTTPLHIAALRKNLGIARALVTAGANKRALDPRGMEPRCVVYEAIDELGWSPCDRELLEVLA